MTSSSVSFDFLRAAAIAAILVGCSDPVPPPAQGGAKLYLTAQSSKTDPTRGCTRANTGVTHVIPLGNDLDKDKPGTRVVNGADGASVSCRVASGGGGFSFQGAISLGAISLEVNGSINGTTGTANVATNTPETLYMSNRDENPPMPCNITVNQGKIASGYIYADWVCPSLGDPAEPSLLCQGAGTFVFENCDE